MWFTPKYTTKQMKEKHGNDFTYEISCDQMCGSGHWNMRGTIIVETQEEFDAWLVQKTPQYILAKAASKPASTPPVKDSANVTPPVAIK